MAKSQSLSLRKKLLVLLIVPVLVSTIVGIVVSSIKIKNQGYQALEHKSNAILSRLESVRNYVATQNLLSSTISEYATQNPDGNLSEMQKKTILKQVPIIASWTIGLDNAEKDNYKFRVVADNPRNPNHTPSPLEKEFLNRFKEKKETGINFYNDKENTLWVMRPVYLHAGQSCLMCHGKKSESPFNNGKDILGYDMEEWSNGNLHGMFMVISDLKPVQSQVRSAIINISGIGILIGILAVVLGSVLISRIVTTIKQIRSVSQKVAQGDLTSKVEIESNDELGDLAEYINNMIDSMNDILTRIKQSVGTILNATYEISATSQDISDKAQSQAAQFEEISGSIENTAQNAETMNHISVQVVKNAGETDIRINEMIQAIGEIELSSKQIGSSIEVISEIAFQTNLLALNASVEAAHAGEKGKGFGVVANEVKKLAEKTTVSSREISQLVNITKNNVLYGAEISRNAVDKIKEVILQINQSAQSLQTITISTRELATAMNANTNITASYASVSEQLAASASALAEQADDFNTMVEHFKLK